MTLTDQIEDRLSNHGAVETLAEELQPVLRAALGRLPQGVVSALHGDPQGHPLHPALVHLPLGGWMVAALLDFLPGDAAPENREQTERAADLALLLATLGAVPTIAAGWTDWSNTRQQARRTGLIHGTLAETAFLLSGASLLARHKGKRGLGKALSGAGLGAALVAGLLGGQLVYGHGLGVGATLSKRQG